MTANKKSSPECLADISEKGGVGKTSVAAGLLAVAAEDGLNVLGSDLDPRATLTKELGVEDAPYSVNDLLYVDPYETPTDPAELIHDAIVPAGPHWPSNVRVLAAERALGRRESDPSTGMELRLKRAFEGLKGDVDLIVMDCPPRAGGKLVGAAIIAATRTFIPATLTEDGYDGAVEATRSINHYTGPGGLNQNLILAGVVRSIVPRDRDMRDVHRHHEKALLEEFDGMVCDTRIMNYAIREECRTACVPITSAPGPQGKALVNYYRSVLKWVLEAKKGSA